jgi:4-hydroxy-tetrahydrodipicolinate synthase
MDAISGDLYVSATKAALRLIGMSAGDPRPPRMPLPDVNVTALRQVLNDLDILDDEAA